MTLDIGLAARLAKVEALADEWEAGTRRIGLEWNVPIAAAFGRDLRAVLAPAPAAES